MQRRASFLRSATFAAPFPSLDDKEALRRSGLEIHQARRIVVATWLLSFFGLLAAFFLLGHFFGLNNKIEPGVVLIPGVLLLLGIRYSIARLLLWCYSRFR